jgi:hypothetical protein
MKVRELCQLLPMVVSVLGAAGAGPDLAHQWQGAWVVRDAEYPGSIQAWSVQGNSVVVYDPYSGSRESQRFTLQSPCRLVRTEPLGGGSSIVTANTFAFAVDGLHVGPAAAAGGARRGALLTACVGHHVYTVDTRTGRCLEQPADLSMGPMTSDADCSVSGTPPSLVLRRPEEGRDVQLSVWGNGLLSPELVGSISERQPSFNAAVQRADALRTR